MNMQTIIGSSNGSAQKVIFGVFILIIVLVYLGYIHKKPHIRSFKESVLESSIWIFLAFSIFIGFWISSGNEFAIEFGYTFFKETVLSVDNILIFAGIYSVLRVPKKFQSYFLAWGILIMIPSRAIMISLGSIVLIKMDWLSYGFGSILMFAGIRYFFNKNKQQKHKVVDFILKSSICRKLGLTRIDKGKLLIAPLFIVLVIEITDSLSSVDSISSILSRSNHHHFFQIFVADIFAALMIRSLYFIIIKLMEKHRFLIDSFAIVAICIGLEMITVHFIHVSLWLSVMIDIMVIVIPIFMAVLNKKIGGISKFLNVDFNKKKEWPFKL
ncbi:MAG TPA: hypothetical protein ENI61_04570 [Ignavibacteria bacterium]|nr:hypothetical protein [Ignavibacteria bacterium]